MARQKKLSHGKRKKKQSGCFSGSCICLFLCVPLFLIHLHYRVALLHAEALDADESSPPANFGANPDAVAYLKAAKDGKVLNGEGVPVHAALSKGTEIKQQEQIDEVLKEVIAEVPGRDTKYLLFDHLTWDQAAPACKIRGKRMCTLAEICPHGKGKFPAITPLVGDHWLPVSDHSNGWVSTGDLYMERICGYHEDCCGKKPSWGEPGGKGLGGTVLACCGDDGEPAPGGILGGLMFTEDPEIGSLWGGKIVEHAAATAVAAVAAVAPAAVESGDSAVATADDGPIETEFDAFFHVIRTLAEAPKDTKPDTSILAVAKIYAAVLEAEEKAAEDAEGDGMTITVDPDGLIFTYGEIQATFNWDRVDQVSECVWGWVSACVG
jgi:hypothetical protein